VQNYYPEFDNDRGVSLVFLNTPKSIFLYDMIKPQLSDTVSTYEEGLRGNPAIVRSAALTPQHDEFWKLYKKKGIAAISIMIRRIKYNYPRRIYRKLKSLLKKKL